MTDTVNLPRSVVEQAIEDLEMTINYVQSPTRREDMRNSIEALRTALEQPQDHPEQHLGMVPAGWKLVPVEPNMSMTQSALNASRRWSEYEAPLPRGQELWAAGVCWEAMLAAAPKPPAVKESCWPKLDKPARVGGGTFGIGTSARHVVMAAQRAHDEHVRVGKLTHEQMVEEERYRRVLWDLIHGPIDTAPQPPVVEQPQGEQEPVAWINPGAMEWGKRQCEKVLKLTRKAQPEYDFTEPLYTHPQPPRQPLTCYQIHALFQKDCMDGNESNEIIAFARAIEAAHGIKEQK